MFELRSGLMLLLPALLAVPVAFAAGSDVQTCRQLSNDAARLQCYDRLFAADATPSVLTPATTPAPASNVTTTAVERFGMENRVDAVERTEAIESRLLGEFKGWEPKQKFTLENGQIWQVSDGSSAYFQATDPKVWVERGAFGSFYLRFDGLNKKPKVKRLK